jgi:hypothetical protein
MAFQRPIVALFGLAVALFLALRVLGSVNRMSARQQRQAALASGSHEAFAGIGGVEQLAGVPAAALAPPKPAPAVSVADPEMTARVVKSWLKD